MKHIRILSAQDISCFGQCSLTVALPVLSALGIETSILPTAILSTHTAGFSGYTFRDLKDDLAAIAEHWKGEGIDFDAVYTGYLGHKKDVDAVLEINASHLNKGPFIVDPAFGDQGKLYGGFDKDYVAAMRPLCASADVLLPNLTEAYFLLDLPYNPNPDFDEIERVLHGLLKLGAKNVILKGIGDNPAETGFVVYDGHEQRRYRHARIPKDFHGTGDVFASVFVGGYLRGLDIYAAARLAADFTFECIVNTINDPAHGYGVHFEQLLFGLEARLRQALGE